LGQERLVVEPNDKERKCWKGEDGRVRDVRSLDLKGNAGMAGSCTDSLCKAWIGRTGEMRNSPAVMGLDRQARKSIDCNVTDRHGMNTELQDWKGQDLHRKVLMGDAGWERLAVALRSMVRRDPGGCCSAGKVWNGLVRKGLHQHGLQCRGRNANRKRVKYPASFYNHCVFNGERNIK
jgi:hypothetical protein